MIKKQNSFIFFLFFLVFSIIFPAGVLLASDSSQAPEGYSPEKGVKTSFQTLAGEGTPNVLMIQSAIPWGSNADTTVLDLLGYSYRVVDMTEIPNININDYQVVLIVNDQVQSFYDEYANTYDKFENYVEAGGTLVFFAVDRGHANGNNYTNLPGGVEVGDDYDTYNVVADNDHPIVTQILTGHPNGPLTDADLHSNYASHNYFIENTLPAGADIIFRSVNNDSPTLVVYRLGAGTVIASGVTWEWNYDRYTGPGIRYGLGRALPDVFKYAFSIAGAHKTSGVKVDIYPEDYWLTQRQEVYKSRDDLLDIVASVTNNTTPNEEQTEVSLLLTIGNAQIDPTFLKVYKRASAEEIVNTQPVLLTEGAGPGQFSVVSDNAGIMEITVNDLTIPTKDSKEKTEFVFRFKIVGGAEIGKTLDPKAELSGENINTVSEKLSDGGSTVTVLKKGKIIITNRELMYKQFAQDNKGVSQLNQLWGTLYGLAAGQRAVVYHVDKYDRDDDGDPNTNITIDWLADRQKLGNGAGGNYQYDGNTGTNVEEATINQVATKIKALIKDIITRSGGLANGRYVAILGGDMIIPFYRVFDPNNDVLATKGHHTASDVTKVDADNNFMFSDMYYRDFDGQNWKRGDVENIFVGRVTGTNAKNMESLLESSNSRNSTSSNVIKVENNQRNGLLTKYTKYSENAGYTVINDIDGVSIDVPNMWLIPGGGEIELNFPYTRYNPDNIHDIAKWNPSFNALFTGTANNFADFDVMRNKSHGSVGTISGSLNGDNFYSADDINDNKNAIQTHLSTFNPFFMFDSCLNGLVDGTDVTQITKGLLNTLLPLGVRGALAFSAVSHSPLNSRLLDNFYKKQGFIQSVPAGQALARANRSWGGNNAIHNRQRLALNLFGLPWLAITSPHKRQGNNAAVLAVNDAETSSTIQMEVLGTLTKISAVDSSAYTTSTTDGYDVVEITGFDLLLEGTSTPVVPMGQFTINIPLNAVVDLVTVDFIGAVDLGTLNIPAFQLPPPMPDPDGLLSPGGYVDSPTDLGVFPAAQFSYKTAEVIGYKQVIVDVYPLIFDTGTQATTIYTSANINVTYTTPDQGLVQSFSSDKRTYAVGEAIVTSTDIENISASSQSFTVTVDVLDLSDKVISTNSTTVSIATNTVDAVVVNLNAPATGGPYRLSMTASDGINSLGSSEQEISVVEGQINSFTVPASIDKGNFGSFVSEFENLSQAQITIYEDIYIYNASGEEVAHLPQTIKSIAAVTKETSTAQWYPPVQLPTGTYTSYITVKVNNLLFTKRSEEFNILGLNEITLSMGWNLISLNLVPADTAIASVLAQITGKYSSVWAYVNGSWLVYDANNPGFSDLTTIDAGYGYWINMTDTGVLPNTGTAPSKDVSLNNGWNLVGFNSAASMNTADALATIAGQYVSAWAFINGAWQVYDPANPGFSDLLTMEPGYGYWINATAASTWTLP